jgi:hypothetical protein
MTHGNWGPTERPSLRNLLAALQGGLDPNQAYGILGDVMGQHESMRREAMARAEDERRRQEAEQDEAEALAREEAQRRQETLGSIGELIVSRAQEGASPSELQAQLGIVTQAYGMPDLEGAVGGLVNQAYPRPQYVGDPKVTGGGRQQQTMIRGDRPELSPLYQPPETEQTDLPTLGTIKEAFPAQAPTEENPYGTPARTETLQDQVATKVMEGINAGAPLEDVLQQMTASAIRQGYPPDVVAAVQQQVAFMYDQLASQGPRAPAPRSAPRAPAGGQPNLLEAFGSPQGREALGAIGDVLRRRFLG